MEVSFVTDNDISGKANSLSHSNKLTNKINMKHNKKRCWLK